MPLTDNKHDDQYYSFDEALKDPNSFEYKSLMDLYQIVADKHELSEHLMVHLFYVNEAVEKAFASKLEARILKEEAKQRKEAAIARNEELKAEEAKTVSDMHRESLERVMSIKELDKKLYKYEQMKGDIENKIILKEKEIETLNKIWEGKLVEAADKFIDDNFNLNADGKYTSTKNPEIELRDGGADVIKKIYTDAKSPAEMQKHNPNLIDNPERMMVTDDVRKELHMARKLDKIVDPEIVKKENKKRKIIVKQIVRDVDGNPVFEVDALGKKRVKTERVELTPETRKILKDIDEENNESTKKHTKLVCLGDICFIKNELIKAPITHTNEQTILATKLLVKGNEKSWLEEKRDQIEEKIIKTKEEIAEHKTGFDDNYKQLVDLHPEMKQAEETPDQYTLFANKKVSESSQDKIEDKPEENSPNPKTR